MKRFLCGRVVLLLVGIVVALQIYHMVLLNRLEAQRNAHHALIIDRDGEPSGSHTNTRANAGANAQVETTINRNV